MEPLLIALALAGLLVGATGTWSPCGFSMIETIGPTGHTGGLRTTLAASATFAPFAVLGGVITFGLIASFGQALPGAGGSIAYGFAAALALAAAVAEARGTPIVPQVRRQLPVGWRSSAPMPLASAGYGVLLGLGFTTFVLSYGVWALMGVSLALGDLTAGLVVGISFGVGRALPIIALAPFADRPFGERACDAMALRPGLLRGARAGDAVALVAVAGALLAGAGAAGAATNVELAPRQVASNASDPSVAGPALAYESRPGRAILIKDGKRIELLGSDPAIGGPYVAVIHGGRVEVLDRATLNVQGGIAAKGADALAISRHWIAIRRVRAKGDQIIAAPLSGSGSPGKPVAVTRIRAPGQLSRPAVDGNTMIVARSKSSSSSLLKASLHAGGSTPRMILSSWDTAFTGPSVSGTKIAYVATTRRHQSVRIKGSGGGKGHEILQRRRGPPTLWTTALGGDRVYVTIVAKGGRAKLISARR
jgi:hypothetical protein